MNQDCSSLGYKKQTCPERTIKCPFDTSYVYCISCQSEYQYTCSGTGYAGGSGTACGGKYTACTCASGYTWDETNGTCDKPSVSCTIGTLYYSDGKCYDEYIASKTLLGIVIYEKSASESGWIMTHKPIATGIVWGGYGTDISGLPNYTSESNLTDIQASCTNTDIITAYGSSSTYPAAWAAKNYTEGGKRWCLPSGGLLNTALNNSANLTKFNAAVYKIQASADTSAATILGNVSGGYEHIWASSEYSSNYAWYFYAITSGWLNMSYANKYDNGSHYSVRPVMEF